MKNGWVYKTLLTLLCLFSIGSGQAATIDEGAMVNLTLADGLTGETVHRVITDHNGYTWIATTGGISIYNGRHLMTLRIPNAKGHALEVKDLCETKDNSMYAATDDGLYRLTTTSGTFKRFLPQIERPIALLSVGDTLYIGGEQGLQIYDGHELRQQDVGASKKGLDNIVRHYVRDDKGFIWFLGRHNLNCYDPGSKKITHYELNLSKIGRAALTQFEIVEGKFFIGSSNMGLFVYDLQTHESRWIEGVGKIVKSVSKSSDGLIAIATDGAGAYLLDPETEQVVERFSMDASGEHRLPTNALYSFYRDRNGINWLGTVRCGLVYNPHSSMLFQAHTLDGLSTIGMNVRSFQIRGSESVIGLQDGLWFVDAQRHIRKYFSPEELGGHIVNNICWWNGYYYIGMFDGGVRLLDPKTMTLQRQTWSPLLDKTTVGDMKVASDNSLWIGCSDGLLIISADGNVRQLTEQNSHMIGGIIISITFDKDHNAWLTGAKGLSLYSAASRDVVETNYPEGFFHHEPFMRGFLGHDGVVYMRNGPQLFYTDSRMEKYGELTLPVHLIDRWCRSMTDNGQGRLWLASERGLLGIDYQGKGLIQLGEGEGLLGHQVSEVQMDDEGRLWVATNKGLFMTTQQDYLRWQSQLNNRLTLYNVRKGSDLIDQYEMSQLSEHHEIRLCWHFTSQVLQAEPLLLDYARQQGRFYEYRVDGGKWILLDDGQPMDIRDLLLGSHQLTVRMAGVKGTETVFHLTVVPSGWAIFEMILILVAIVLLWLWYRYRKNSKLLLSERDEIEDALIAVEQELEEVKSEAVPAEDSSSSQKYQKVKIDDAECEAIVHRMREYLERERVYVNADLKMKDLADVLHLSSSKLSQVFNLYLKENYYEFINRYRLTEFKKLIEQGEYKRYTITALSEQCGFKKSNFFSTFRKVEGMTPAEYLKKQGVTPRP